VIFLQLIDRPLRDQLVEHLTIRHIIPIQSAPAKRIAIVEISPVPIDDLTAFFGKRIEFRSAIAFATRFQLFDTL
jgi:hypothetical protein